MKKLITLLLFFILAVTLTAKEKGLNQENLVSLHPSVASTNNVTNSTVEIKFNLPIKESSIKKNTIVLKQKVEDGKNIKIKSITTLSNENTLIFTPNKELLSGEYNVRVSSIKLKDYSNSSNSFLKKAVYKVCSHFYDDVKDCPLCKLTCNVKTKPIKYSFSVDKETVKITSLTLSQSSLELNLENQVDINVTALYDDNTTADVTEEVVWSMSDGSIISIDKDTIRPTNEGTTTLEAQYQSQKSQEIQITVYKEVNGYKLPPEPDQAINNSTLLGIDSNSNGVRDDVERKIILTYQEPIKIEPLMAAVKIGQEILENPIGLAREHSDKMDRVGNCWSYIRDNAPHLIDQLAYIKFYENNMYNTKERVRTYIDYNHALGGGVYGSGPADWTADKCNFDVKQMLKDMK